MKITMLNLQLGGGPRIPRLADYFLASGSDVWVGTEFRDHNRSKELDRRAEKKGLTRAAATRHKQNGVAIWSALPFKPLELDASKDIVGIRIGRLIFLAAYFQPKRQAEGFSALNQVLDTFPKSTSLLVLGDFNTGLHRRDEEGKTFAHTEAFAALSSRLTDVWRHFHGGDQVYSTVTRSGKGFRIDHAFASHPALENIRSCSYDPSPRNKKWSDHSAMTLEMELAIPQPAPHPIDALARVTSEMVLASLKNEAGKPRKKFTRMPGPLVKELARLRSHTDHSPGEALIEFATRSGWFDEPHETHPSLTANQVREILLVEASRTFPWQVPFFDPGPRPEYYPRLD